VETTHIEKPIRLSGHARNQLQFRGVTQREVMEAIRKGTWKAVDHCRMDCSWHLAPHPHANETCPQSKTVRPVFVDEPEEIVVVTVYVDPTKAKERLE
jgi:hypothetical protein